MRNYTFKEMEEILEELNEYLEDTYAGYQIELYENEIDAVDKYHTWKHYTDDGILDDIYDAYHSNGVEGVENLIFDINWIN